VRILVAPDKFKGSLGAPEVAEQIAAGLRDALPQAEITCLPIADGGEGTAEVICRARGGTWHECDVHDPLGRMVRATYCTIGNGRTAVMEMSAAAGLWRLAPGEYDPLRANTCGVGEMLRDAQQRGVREVIMGLGGSATVDGGFGMARALGFRFFAGERELARGPGELVGLTHIIAPERLDMRIVAAADVRNPLLGIRGAAHVFGPQKGANPEEVELLEAPMEQLTRCAGSDFCDVPGAGAAGGLGFALMTFCGAELRAGFDVVAELVGLESAMRSADVVITGEGRLDAQTAEGKAPAGVACLARRLCKPVHAIVGEFQDRAAVGELFDSISPLARNDTERDEALARAPELLRERARSLGAQLRA
jgi:glycerate 2-kinase